MKKLFSSLLTLCFLLPSVLAGAQSANVKVKIAPFYTEIDYMSVDNRYVEFPLITYKDITYFPMTYNLCERLDLSSEKITFLESTPPIQEYTLTTNNGALEGNKVDAVYKDGKVYIDDFPVFSAVDSDMTSDIYAVEYSLGDSSLLYIESRFGNAPAPYTQHSEYLFKKSANGIENLGWDEKIIFAQFIPIIKAVTILHQRDILYHKLPAGQMHTVIFTTTIRKVQSF